MIRLAVLVMSLFTFIASVSAEESTSSTLGTYNLILLEDYNFQGGDVQGQVLIGGDLNASGHAVEFGSRLANTNTAIDAVTIMGDVNANQIRVLNDNNLVYGGALNVSHVELNDGNDGKAIANADLSIDDVAASLHADSAYFASLSANGTYSDGIFNYIGTDSVAVFNVSADDVFAQNSNLSLNWGDAETVIINVSASNALANDIVVGGGVNLNNGFNGSEAFSNVLWNFYDAESIDFNSLAVKGSVLAPLATTSGGASFDGSFAAVSYTGAREFHNYVFNYEAPSAPPVVSVPEPPTIAVLAVLLLFLSFRRARRY
jgi:choice-of-anchor A domain-containing protein